MKKSRTVMRRLLTVESLEARLALTSNLYLDFGDNFPVGGFNVTKNDLRAPVTGGGLGGPPTLLLGNPVLNFQGLNTYMADFITNFDYDGDGVENNADYTKLRADTLSVVQRVYAPFDVNVQIAPALNNTSSTTYFNGIRSTLQLGANTDGEFDGWIFLASVTSGGDSIPSSSGISNGTDIGVNNAVDNTGIVFVDKMLDPFIKYNSPSGAMRGPSAALALGDNSAHEAGHDFGLQHIFNTKDKRTLAVANSETMAYGLSWSQYGVFTRYPLVSDYVLATPATRPGPEVMSYDRLIGNSVLGRRAGSAEYITGTGAHDSITITSTGANTASVTIQAFSDATHTTALDVPGPDGSFNGSDVPATVYTRNGSIFSYPINTTNGILIEAGEGDDWITIDSKLSRTVTVRGMSGVDRLQVVGDGVVAGKYLPRGSNVPSLVSQEPITFADAPANLGGTVIAGATNILFEDFEATSQVTVTNMADFVMLMPNSADVITIGPGTGIPMQITATSDLQPIVPLAIGNTQKLTIDSSTNDTGGADTITVNATLVGALTNAMILNTGGGEDSVRLTSTTGLAGLTAGIQFNGGSGNDSLFGSASDTSWKITGINSGQVPTNVLAFQSVESLNGGLGKDTFEFSGTGRLGVAVRGGGAENQLDYKTQASRNVTLTAASATGMAGGIPGLVTTFEEMDAIIGSIAGGTDSLTGLNVDSNWQMLTSKGTYQVPGVGALAFEHFETLKGNAAVDKFKVAPSTTFPLSIQGAQPITNPGDELEVVLTGTVNPQLNVTKPNQDGNFTFASHQTITYTSIEKLSNYDFGDAPKSYMTLLANNGARHRLGSGLSFGTVDPESNGAPTANAQGDDLLGAVDDEEGITLPSVVLAGFRARIDATVTNPGKLDAWVDWNGNGLFSAAERIATSLSVVAGTNSFVFDVPEAALNGVAMARFRLSTLGSAVPTGLAEDGEVEDHPLNVLVVPEGGAVLVPDPLFPGGSFLVIGGTANQDTLIFEDYHPDNTIRAIRNGQVLAAHPIAGVTRVGALGRADHDKIILDLELPQPAEFVGGAGNDQLFGSSADDYFRAGEGNDLVYGFGGDDDLDGEAGNDTLFAGDGDDLVNGGEDNDAIYGGDGNDILLGGRGDDRLYAGRGNDLVIGGAGRDILFGEQGDDLLVGARTLYDENGVALNLLRDEWTSARSYAERRLNIRSGVGPVLAGTGVKLNASSIVGDAVEDDLFGGIDDDWFLTNGTDNTYDRRGSENIN